jgi:hypothetical protein
LSSTHFCLAKFGAEYVVYQPYSGPFSVDLMAGTYHFEWLEPTTNRIRSSGNLSVPEGKHSFNPGFSGDAVLYLRAATSR